MDSFVVELVFCFSAISIGCAYPASYQFFIKNVLKLGLTSIAI